MYLRAHVASKPASQTSDAAMHTLSVAHLSISLSDNNREHFCHRCSKHIAEHYAQHAWALLVVSCPWYGGLGMRLKIHIVKLRLSNPMSRWNMNPLSAPSTSHRPRDVRLTRVRQVLS